MSNETSARIEGESEMDKSEGVKMGEFGRVDPSPFPVDEKFTIYRDDENDFVIQSQRETGLVAHGDTPEEAVYNMREVLDMAASLGCKPEPKVGESGLSDEQAVKQKYTQARDWRGWGDDGPIAIWNGLRGESDQLSGHFKTAEEAWTDARALIEAKPPYGVDISIEKPQARPEAKPEPLPNTLSTREEPCEWNGRILSDHHDLVNMHGGGSRCVKCKKEWLAAIQEMPAPNTLQEERMKMREVINEFRTLVRWLNGEIGEFPERPLGAGPYWWRNEMQRNSAVTCSTADELLANSKGKRMVQVCPKCRKPIWGEGGNPKTGVRYFSHTTREDSDACCEEIEIHPGEEIPYAAAPKVVDSKEEQVFDLTQFLRLAEHKIDQRLQGQYTEAIILGMLLKMSRELLLKHKIPALDPRPKVEEQDGEQELPPRRTMRSGDMASHYAIGETDAYMNALEAENKLLKAESVAPASLPKYKHFCKEWDMMEIDETWPEFDACLCFNPERKQPLMKDDGAIGEIRRHLTETAIACGKRKGHDRPDINDLYSAAISIIASRAAAPVALPNLECGDEEHLDPAIKLLADVMHLWVDGYISKNPKSMAPDSISSDVFEAVERFLSTHEIAVDYCGWHIKPVALPTHQIVDHWLDAAGYTSLRCSCGRTFVGVGDDALASSRASFEAHLPEKERK